jgi:hypothetical protein
MALKKIKIQKYDYSGIKYMRHNVTLCNITVTPNVFQFIGPSNDGRKHGRATYMFLGITPHDSRQAVFPYWAIGQGQGLKIWSKKYKSKEKNLNVFLFRMIR